MLKLLNLQVKMEAAEVSTETKTDSSEETIKKKKKKVVKKKKKKEDEKEIKAPEIASYLKNFVSLQKSCFAYFSIPWFKQTGIPRKQETWKTTCGL